MTRFLKRQTVNKSYGENLRKPLSEHRTWEEGKGGKDPLSPHLCPEAKT